MKIEFLNSNPGPNTPLVRGSISLVNSEFVFEGEKGEMELLAHHYTRVTGATTGNSFKRLENGLLEQVAVLPSPQEVMPTILKYEKMLRPQCVREVL